MGILVNGNGNPHVYAHQDSDLIAGIVGNQTSIMPVGDKFEANQEDANTIALSSGVIITKEGRRIQLDAGTIDEFIIPTGAQDVQSFYIIGYHLYEDGNSDQLCETFVRKMDSASDTIPESTFRSGATEVYVSLYRVTQDSLNITDIDLLLPYADSIAEVKRNGGNKNLAAIEDGSTASQSYVKGEFVIVGGQFCEVTSSISTNDAFIAYPLPNYNIKAGTVGEQITALNQNLTKCLTYNETTDFYGAVNPNTHQWVDLLYAGFNVNDIFYKTWKNQAYNRTHNGGGQIEVNSNHIYVDSSTTYNTYDSMMLLTPINVTPSSVLNLRSQLYHSNGCVATIFITDQSNLSAFTFQSSGHCSNADLLILAEGVNDTQGVYTAHDIQAQNLSQLMSSKYTDLTKQYYIGIVCNCGYGSNHSNCEITELSVG